MIELNVTGMTCNHCVKAVTTAIQQQLPHAQVTVELATGKVTITPAEPDTAIIERLRAAIADEGYAATPLPH